MKKTPLVLALVLLPELFSIFPAQGNPVQYVSATQYIVSTSKGWPTLFRLNVTYPYEAKTGENLSIYLQLWQGKNTTVYVSNIQVWIPANLTQTLVKNQTLQNPQQTETLVVDKTVTANVQKRQRWTLSVSYSVKDISVATGSIWTTGSNNLASFNIYPQTNQELTSQLSETQKHVADLQNQEIGLIFMTVYLAVTLGIAVPFIQRRRNKKAKKTNNEKEQGRLLIWK